MAGSGDTMFGWELSVLFLGFMVISMAWQLFIAIVTFLNSFYGGAKTIWLTRLKEEVLDVGVISLVLVFLNPQIANICVKSSGSSSSSYYPPPPASGRRLLHLRQLLGGGGAAAPCPDGERHLFPADTIATAHYLLFFLAVVHILYSLLTYTLTLQRFAWWGRWERLARLEAADNADAPAEGEAIVPMPVLWVWRWLSYVRHAVLGGVDKDRYFLLRGLFQLRSRFHQVTAFLDTLHYTNVIENAMEIDMAGVVSHGWLQALIVAMFTLYTTKGYQILWISAVGVVIQTVVVVKMVSIIRKVLTVVEPVENNKAFGVYSINKDSPVLAGLPLYVRHPVKPVGADGSGASSSAQSTPASSDDEGGGAEHHEDQQPRRQLSRGPRDGAVPHAVAEALEAAQGTPLGGAPGATAAAAAPMSHELAALSYKRAATSASGASWSPRSLLPPPRPSPARASSAGALAPLLLPPSASAPALAVDMGPQFGAGSVSMGQTHPAPGPAAVITQAPQMRISQQPMLPGQPMPGVQAAATLGAPGVALAMPMPGAYPSSPALWVRTPSAAAAAAAGGALALHGGVPVGEADDDGAEQEHLDMSIVEARLRALFWFKKPMLLLWLSHLVFLQNSLSITLCVYYIIAYGEPIFKVEGTPLYIWYGTLSANVLFMMYIGWVVMPVYTLVATTCWREPRELHNHIKQHKRAEEEEEGGITGFLTQVFEFVFNRGHHQALRAHMKVGGKHHGFNSVFMANLANQAGVILATDESFRASKLGPAVHVYREYVKIWRRKVRIAQGLEAAPADGFVLKSDVADFRNAYLSLDVDGSATVTTDDLFTQMQVLGTRATKTELQAMLDQIDTDGDKRVAFNEFVVFNIFCFFDKNGSGGIQDADILKILRRLKVMTSEQEVAAMVDLADPDGDRKIGLRQFIKLFNDVLVPDMQLMGKGKAKPHPEPDQRISGGGAAKGVKAVGRLAMLRRKKQVAAGGQDAMPSTPPAPVAEGRSSASQAFNPPGIQEIEPQVASSYTSIASFQGLAESPGFLALKASSAHKRSTVVVPADAPRGGPAATVLRLPDP